MYPNIRTPYTQQWNVTLEKQLHSGVHRGLCGYPFGFDALSAQPQSARSQHQPFKGFLYPGLNAITWIDNGGTATYNSLQFSASKTMGKTLYFTLRLHLAKDLTDQLDSGGFAGQIIQNAYDRSIERGNNTYVPRKRFFTDLPGCCRSAMDIGS